MTLLRRFRRRSAGESGYTLIVVLVGTMIFGLVVAALLTLVATQARSQDAYFRSDAHKRAVDGGLELGLGKLKSVSSADLAAGDGGACVGFDSPLASVQIEGREVSVDCVPGDMSRVDRYIPTKGDSGAVITTLSWGEFPEARPGKVNEVLAIWDLGWALPGFFVASDGMPRIYGDVEVSNNSGVVTQSNQPGALWIDGSMRTVGNSHACDDASLFLSLGSAIRWDVRTTEGCSWWTGGSVTDPGATPISRPLDAAAVPACGTGSLIAFEPGRYDQAAVAALNALFGGACSNRTFWFKPGAYYFEGSYSSSTIAGSAYLTFNDSSSRWVFGEPKNWNPAAGGAAATNFPNACDHEQPGVAIILGANTSLRHLAGFVAMCGPNDERVPVLSADRSTGGVVETYALKWNRADNYAGWQSNGAPGSPSYTSATMSARPPEYPAFGAAWPAAEGSRQVSDGGCAYRMAACEFRWTFTQPSATNLPPNNPGLVGAKLYLRAETFEVAASQTLGEGAAAQVYDSRILIEIKPNGKPACTAIEYLADHLPLTYGSLLEIDLLSTNTSSPCYDTLVNLEDLSKADISIRPLLAAQTIASDRGPRPSDSARLRLDHYFVTADVAAVGSLAPNLHIINGTHEGEAASSFNVFGLVHLPDTRIELMWRQNAALAPAYELPVFVGEVVAKSFVSWNSQEGRRVGPLLARSIVPAARVVTIRAFVDGRLAGTVDVDVSDLKSPPDPNDPVGIASKFRTSNWVYCNKEVAGTATCKD